MASPADRIPRLAVALAVAVVAVLALAPRAGAAELLYWNNWEAEPASIGFANIDGSGGGLVNLTGASPEHPEGLAYDTVTNRLLLTSRPEGEPANGKILFVNLDGSGAGVLNTTGAPLNSPFGVAVDAASRTVYWGNTKGGTENKGTIAWASLDGTGGGQVNTAGATVSAPNRVAVDVVNRRIYWTNALTEPDSISYANLDGSGGGNLDLTGATPGTAASGLAVDPGAGRIYWSDEEPGRVSFAGLAGGGGGDLDVSGATIDHPYGIAIDPMLGRVYWGNFGVGTVRTNAIGLASALGGGGGGITPLVAPVQGPQDPLIIKNPVATAGPQLARSADSRQLLSCSQGEWGGDYPGSFVYQAPRSYAYAWTRNGQPIDGVTQSLKATSKGEYRCAVTATNQAGSTAAESSPLQVKPAKLKVLVKTKKRKAKPRKKATFRVQYYNQGDITSKKPRVCVIVPKKLRKALKAPKCKKLGRIEGRGRRQAKLKVYVRPRAKSKSYKLKLVVKGVPSKPGHARLKVIGKR